MVLDKHVKNMLNDLVLVDHDQLLLINIPNNKHPIASTVPSSTPNLSAKVNNVILNNCTQCAMQRLRFSTLKLKTLLS